jgi:hypothetical protein
MRDRPSKFNPQKINCAEYVAGDCRHAPCFRVFFEQARILTV